MICWVLAAFGVQLRPIYPVLRGTGADFTYGTNFAAYGAPARSVKVWRRDSGFNSPFSLDVQEQWYERYKVRVWFYEDPKLHTPGLYQSLPKLATVNESLFMVWSGYQDYVSGLYDATVTPRQTFHIVAQVVKAIEAHIQALLTPVLYTPPGRATLVMPTATTILVVNLPPLGCIPAMLSLYGGPHAKYDSHGCLSDLNRITERHNKLLGETMDELRAKYPAVKLLYGDAHGVYTDILKDPKKYNVTAPLQACCGVGGAYNFNKQVTCGHAGMVENKFVNLTTTFCADPAAHLSWDGIHTSNTFNKAAVTDFLLGKHITPKGGLNCSPDFTFWDAPS
jgi:alpha-L-fucosidase